MEHENGLRHVFPDNYLMQVTEQVMSLRIEPGSRIAKVWCLVEPDDEEEVHCGDLVTTSEFTSSVVADQKLFFAHEVMKQDCEMRPEWEPYLPKWSGRVFDSVMNYPRDEVKQMMLEEIESGMAT